MARPNLPRSVGSEANLAERIRYERESRGWSPAELARRMTAAGCSIATSAIYKIEDTAKPRRITVDELIAASDVFEVPVPDLLVSVEMVKQARAREVVKHVEEAERDLADAIARYTNFYCRLFEMAAEQDMDLYEFTLNLHSSRQADEPEGDPIPPNDDGTSRLFVIGDDAGNPLPVSDAPLRSAYKGLIEAMIHTAAEAMDATIDKRKESQHGKHQEA